MLDSITLKRFEDALASDRLRELADQMKADGLSQAAIYCLFESFWSFLGEAHREADEEELLGCLECIVGWVHHDCWWFDRHLSGVEIDEYRKTNA